MIVLQKGDYTIAATHNLTSTDSSQLGLSDTIIQKVVSTKEPLVINNALSNANYSSAQSVVDLKLSSVMCVPLIVRTELLGVIYLGNDSITGLFTEDDLRLLQVWAAQAAGILHTFLLNELETDNKALVKLEAQQPSKYHWVISPNAGTHEADWQTCPLNWCSGASETGTGKGWCPSLQQARER